MTFDLAAQLRLYLERADDARARSQQTEIGPSQLGGCRRAVMYQLHGAPKVNHTERLASILGTAIHEAIEAAFAHDDDYLLEIEVPGLPEIGLGPAHVDAYRKSDHSANDWKTSKLKAARYFPKAQQRWQVHTYGFLMNYAGYKVETVRLVSIPRDGAWKDVQVHEEPYDERQALAAMDWLSDLWAAKDTGWMPEPEMSGIFCELYCDYYGPDKGMCPTKDGI